MASPQFALCRASEKDVAELTVLMFETSSGCINELFTGFAGPLEPDQLSFKVALLSKPLLEDPNDIWIVVRDVSSGELVAGSHWRVFMNGTSGVRETNSVPTILEGEKKEKSRRMIESTFKAKSEQMPGPFIHLHICFTKAKYRRQGAGAMMVKWGCDIADLLFLPAWLSATTEGKALYEAFGFYDNGTARQGSSYMTRPARSQPILGGRRKKVPEEHISQDG